MISHRHQCIFVHVSKCAGSSIESAFGIDISNNDETNNANLFGWNDNLKMHLQHCTPQMLLDGGFITREVWETYYKFIIVRNPWDRAYSDYLWLNREQNLHGDFISFIKKEGVYKAILNDRNMSYRGDHLIPQKKYFIVDDSLVSYNRVLRFENLKNDLEKLQRDLNLNESFFNRVVNKNAKKLKHYSYFYNQSRKNIIYDYYREDIEFLKYEFEDFKTFPDHLKAFFTPSHKLI